MESLSEVLQVVPRWLLWSVVIGIAVYWYLTQHHGHWKRVGIPYVPAVPFFGSTIQMFTKLMHDTEVERYQSKGRIYGMYEGRLPVLTVGEPVILRDIFTKDFQFFRGRRRFDVGVPLTDNMLGNLQGENWKRVRTIMTPSFSTGKIKKMISIFIDSAKTLMKNFNAEAVEKNPIDMQCYFGAFTMDVIASSIFGTKIDSHNDPKNLFVSYAKNAFRGSIPWRMSLFLLFPELMRFFRINVFSSAASKFFEKVTLGIVEERKRKKEKRDDFLQLLMDAADIEGREPDDAENEETKEMGHEEGNDKIFKSHQSNKELSKIELVANCVIFFIAGYETTASTLTFLAYELAVNPDIQDRLTAEIDRLIKEKGELNYEAICEMKYMDNVISEILRKYPPVIRLARFAEEDYKIKYNDIEVTIPKEMTVSVPIYAIHHDPQNYPDPEKFDPDRFTPENKLKRHPYAYLPFGAGPRNCLGMRFALMVLKVSLASVLTKFRFATCSETTIPIQFRRGQDIIKPKEVMLNVKIRSNA